MSQAGRTFAVKRQFFENLNSQNKNERITQLKRALLVMHAPTDDIMGIDNAAQIFQAAKLPKRFDSLDGADHLLTRSSDADYAAGVIAAWSTRYVGVEPDR